MTYIWRLFQSHHSEEVSRIKGIPIEMSDDIHHKAEDILSIPPQIEHDDRCFALMHCTTSLLDTEWEGGDPSQAIDYYSQLLSSKTSPISTGLTAEETAQIKHIVDQLLLFRNLIQELDISNPDVSQLIEKIIEECDRYGHCYLPSGWIHIDTGHYCSLKIKKRDDGSYAASFINQGGGAQYHVPLTKGKSKTKTDYQSPEHPLDLTSPLGIQFLQRIALMQIDTRLLDDETNLELRSYIKTKTTHFDTVHQLDEKDLYAILHLLGDPIIEEERNVELHAVTSQRTGTCPSTNTTATIRDSLITLETMTPDKLKRFKISTMTTSLIEAFRSYCQRAADDTETINFRPILKDSIEGHLTRLNKFFPEILSDEEYALGLAIARVMQEKITHDEYEQHQRDKKPLVLPSIRAEITHLEDETLPTMQVTRPEETPLSSLTQQAKLSYTTPPPEDIKNYLNTAVQHFQKKDPDIDGYRALLEMLQFAQSLPISTGNSDDPYWSNVSETEIDDIIISLYNLLQQCHSLTRSYQFSYPINGERFEIAIRCYDIIAQLAQRSYTLNLGSQYALALEDSFFDGCCFYNSETYLVTKQIMDNFERRTKDKRTILSPVLDKSHATKRYLMNNLMGYITKLKTRKHFKGSYFPSGYSDDDLFLDIMTSHPIDTIPPIFYHICTAATFVHSKTKRFNGETSQYGKLSDDDELSYMIIHRIRRHEGTLLSTPCLQIRDKLFKNQIFDDPFETYNLPHRRQHYYSYGSSHLSLETAKFLENTVFQHIQRDPCQRRDHYHPFMLRGQGSRKKAYTEQMPERQKDLPSDIDEELSVIETEPHIQVPKALEWASLHYEELSLPAVQTRISEFLFEYSKIELAFNESPEDFLRLINDFQQKVFEYYTTKPSQENLSTLLWLSETSHYLRQHIQMLAQEQEYDISAVEWIDTRTILKNQLKQYHAPDSITAINTMILHSYICKDELDKKEQLELMTCYISMSIKARQNSREYTFAEVTNIRLFNQHSPAILETLSSLTQEELNTWANQLLRGLSSSSWRIEGRFVVSEKIKIDITQGFLCNSDGTLLQDKAKALQESSKFNRLLGYTTSLPLTINGREARSHDGIWTFIIHDRHQLHIEEAYKTVSINETPVTMHYHDEHEDIIPLSPPQKFLSCHPPQPTLDSPKAYNWWEICEPNEGIFIEDRTGQQHYYYTNNQWYIVDKDLNTISAITASKAPQSPLEKQWLDCMSRYAEPKDIEIHTNTDEDLNQQTVSKIIFKKLNLTFIPKIVDGSKRLYCQEHPGFYLQPGELPDPLRDFPHMFFLINDSGAHKIISPLYRISDNGKSCHLAPQITFQKHPIAQQYVTFRLDKDNKIISDTPAAELYLSILYRALGQFELAVEALEKSYYHDRPNTLECQMIGLLTSPKNLSAQGAAFDCLFYYRMKYHNAKWSSLEDTRIGKEYNKQIQKLEQHAQQQYQQYLKCLSEHKDSVLRMPAYLRPPPHVTAIFPPQPDQTFFTPKVTDAIQEKFLTIPSMQRESILEPSQIYIHNLRISPEDFPRQDTRPSHFTRCYYSPGTSREITPASEYLLTHFVKLFEEAVSSDFQIRQQCLVSLFFLARNDIFDRCSCHEIQSHYLLPLLLFVAHHPREFQDLGPFSNTLDCYNAISTKTAEIHKAIYEENPDLQRVTMTFFDKSVIPVETATIHHRPPLPLTQPKRSFILQKVSETTNITAPLGSIGVKYFAAEEQPVAKTPFKLPLELMPYPSLLETRLLSDYASGHDTNLSTKEIAYTFHEGLSLSDLQQELLDTQTKDQRTSQLLKDEIMELARQTPLTARTAATTSEELSLALLQETEHRSKQRQTIDIDDIIYSILKQNPQILTSKNTFLSEPSLKAIYQKTMEYCLITSRMQQAQEALELIDSKTDITKLDPFSRQKLGEILHKQRTYDIYQYPEFLIYEFATGNILRPGQKDLLIWIINNIDSSTPDSIQHLLVQFAAGGGKTAVIIPLLAQHFARKGLLPVIINTNELYNIALGDIPQRLKKAFGQMMEVVEAPLKFTWTLENLDELLGHLHEWQANQKCLLIKAETWHSLNTAMKITYTKNEIDLAHKIEQVLQFFKDSGIMLNDEGHLVSDPLQQTIITYGNSTTIPLRQQQLFITFYDMLLGRIPGTEEIASIANILHDKHELTDSQVSDIQKQLAQSIAPLLFDTIKSEDLIGYLLSDDKARPPWLKEIASSDLTLAENIVLARAFIQTHLPHILKMQYLKDYGKSIHAQDLTAAPKHDAQDVSSHFSDNMLVMALTIQLTNREGVNRIFTRKILRSLIHQHKTERKYHKTGPTSAEEQFNALLPRETPHVSLDSLPTYHLNQLSITEAVQKHPFVINTYLQRYALPQIQTPKFYASSTPAELQAGFSRSVTFSATPGLQETYPVEITPHGCHFEKAFEAKVIDTLLEESNTSVYTLDSAYAPAELLKYILREHPEEIERMSALIDRGGLLCHSSTEQVTQAYREITKHRSTLDFRGQKLHFSPATETELPVVETSGSDILQALRDKGISRPEEIAFFCFLDLSRTTGTDVYQQHDGRACLTIGKKQTMTETIQAAMRERKLLKKGGQTIFWVVLQKLFSTISKTFHIPGLQRFFYWMIANQSENTRTKLMMRAYQAINHTFEAHAWQMIREGYKTFADFSEVLQHRQQRSPYHIYETASQDQPTEITLQAYIFELQEKFAFRLPREERQRLNIIINQTKKLLETMPMPHGPELHNEVFHHQEMEIEELIEEEEEMEQELRVTQDLSRDFTFAVERYSPETHGLDKQHGKKITLDLPFTLPSLLITSEATQAIQGSKTIKPIQNMLVTIKPGQKPSFLACSTTGAKFYHDEMLKLPPDHPTKYCLVGCDRHILYSSKNTTTEDREKLTSSKDLYHMIAFTHLLNGQIPDYLALRNLIRHSDWNQEQFEQLTQKIHECHISRRPIKVINNQLLYKMLEWDPEPITIQERTTLTALSRLPRTALQPQQRQIVANPPLRRWSWKRFFTSPFKFINRIFWKTIAWIKK